MDSIAKSEIFFFVTTIAVVVVAIFMIVVFVYLAKILHDLKHILGKAKEQSDLISEDLNDLRQNVRESGAKFKFFSKFFNSVMNKKK